MIYDKTSKHYYQIAYNNNNIIKQDPISNSKENENIDKDLMKDIYELIQKYKNLNLYDKGNITNLIKDNKNQSF